MKYTIDRVVRYIQDRDIVLDKMKRESELCVLFIKPGSFPNDHSGNPLQKCIEGLLNSAQIETLATTETILSPEEIRKVYYDIFGDPSPNPFLAKLQKDIMIYLSSEPIFCYLLYGTNVVEKAQTIKEAIRKKNSFSGHTTTVKNVLHTSERKDIALDVNLLFRQIIECQK